MAHEVMPFRPRVREFQTPQGCTVREFLGWDDETGKRVWHVRLWCAKSLFEKPEKRK